MEDRPESLVPFKGNLSSMGIGLLFGAQFKIAKRINLDWWILGPYYTSNNLNLSAKNLNLTMEEENELRDSFGELEIGWLKIDSEVSSDHVSLKSKASFGAIRGFGFCISYLF